MNTVTNKIVTPIPSEFKIFGTISWKVIELKDRNYDGIIGQNILEPLCAKIDLENKNVEVNGNRIMFINSDYPFDIYNI